MQTLIPVPHSWREAAQIAIAIFVTWLTSSVLAALALIPKLLLNRGKSSADVHLSNAQTELTLAQAEGERIRTKRTSAELIDELNRLGAESAMQLRELEEKVRHKDSQIDILESEVETARRAGFLQRDESGGTGPNPAA